MLPHSGKEKAFLQPYCRHCVCEGVDISQRYFVKVVATSTRFAGADHA